MKNIICIILTLFLFLFCFVFDRRQEDYKGKIPYIEDNEPTTINETKKPKPTKVNKNLKNENKNPLIKKAKKFSYPSSLKHGKITLYLNNPTQYNLPSNEPKVPVCIFLNNEINKAEKSIDFAIYGFDKQDKIINSLLKAKSRGVLLRGVSDSDELKNPTYQDNLKLKDVDIVYDNSKKIMHNKFFIIDDKFVLTGSMNISNTGCGGYNANSVVVIEDDKIINAYKKEFKQMYEGKFKNLKQDFSTPFIDIGYNTQISVNFSPSVNIYNKVFSPQIKAAKTKIRMSIFVLTHNQLIQDLIEAKQRGVEIYAIIDATSAKNYKKRIESLKEAGIKVKIENWGGKDHEKTISIDDNILIMGSANFSYSGFLKNDENVVVIKNRELTTFYNGFFDKMYNSIDDIYLKYYPKAEGMESGNSCTDKIDNDFDGKIDNEDEGCIKR